MLFGIRHGETDEDAEPYPKFSGPGPIPLNSKGRDQAEAAGEFLKPKGVSYLLTSPIPRSTETAEIIGEIIGVKPVVLDLIRDWDNGAAAGCNVAQILPFVIYFERNPDLVIPGGEDYAKFWTRSEDGDDYLFDQPFEDINLAFVTHSRYLAVAKMRIDGKGMSPTDFSGSPKPGGVVGISRDENAKLNLELLFGSWNGDTR